MLDEIATPPASPADRRPSAPHGFAAVLRDRTASIHREAERSGFLAELIRGRATRGGYALFLRNLVPVYDMLERALDVQDSALFAPFADPRMRRLGTLAADLDEIAGRDWAETHAVLPETAAYVEAIAAAAPDERLVAHAYARYLGDLSGGQILKPILARTLDLAPSALTFLDFPGFDDLNEPKAAMRIALDLVAAAQADAVVNEAIAAFRHNIALSQAVKAALA